MLRLYKSAVRPHLEYCTAAWSPYYIKDKELIEIIQHKFTRMIPEIKDLPYMERLHQLNLWTWEKRRTRTDLIEVYKIIHGLTAVKFESFFEFDNYSRTRGHIYKLQKNRFNRDLRQRFLLKGSSTYGTVWMNEQLQPQRPSTLNCFKRNLENLRNSTKMGLIWTDVARP